MFEASTGGPATSALPRSRRRRAEAPALILYCRVVADRALAVTCQCAAHCCTAAKESTRAWKRAAGAVNLVEATTVRRALSLARSKTARGMVTTGSHSKITSGSSERCRAASFSWLISSLGEAVGKLDRSRPGNVLHQHLIARRATESATAAEGRRGAVRRRARAGTASACSTRRGRRRGCSCRAARCRPGARALPWKPMPGPRKADPEGARLNVFRK